VGVQEWQAGQVDGLTPIGKIGLPLTLVGPELGRPVPNIVLTGLIVATPEASKSEAMMLNPWLMTDTMLLCIGAGMLLAHFGSAVAITSSSMKLPGSLLNAS